MPERPSFSVVRGQIKAASTGAYNRRSQTFCEHGAWYSFSIERCLWLSNFTHKYRLDETILQALFCFNECPASNILKGL